MVDLAQLLDLPLAPAEFYTEFLQRLLPVFGGIAGAVWTRGPHDNFQLEQQLNLSAVGLDELASGEASHAAILHRVARGNRPVWVAPQRGTRSDDAETAAVNLTRYAVLLAPIQADDEVAGIVEVWLESGKSQAARQTAARELAMAAGVAAAYLHKARWRQLQDQQQRGGQVEAFALRIHASLNPREVAYLVANEGRRLVDCDQVSVALGYMGTLDIVALSGAAAIEKRSRLVQSMQHLFDSVLAWGEPLVFAGTQDESLPPAVRQALDAYLAESNRRLLIVLPLHSPRKDDAALSRAALMAENFQPSGSAEILETKLHMVAAHAAAALHNAVAYRHLSGGWFSHLTSWLRAWTRGKRSRKAGLVGALALLLIGVLTLVPAGLRLDARGQLLPKDRQIVYAHLQGKVVDLKAQHGDVVEKGQELVFLEDLDSQLKVEQLGLKVAFAEQRLAMLGEQIAKAGGEERNALIKERINQEYELRKAAAERDIRLQGSLNPRKAAVLAPLAGKVVTFDTREQLVGKTVKPGDPLVRIARVDGPWEIELLIPEARLAPLRDGLQRAPDGELIVDLLLASHPLRTFQGKLCQGGLGGETVVKDNAVVLPVRVQVADADLAAQLRSLPVGLEVRARIHCGTRSLGRVWFGDLVEFFYDHLWF